MLFTTSQVSKITGFAVNNLQQHIYRGHLKPSRKAEGSGQQHLWSWGDLYRVELFRVFLDYGFSAKEAGELVAQIAAKHLTPTEFIEGDKPTFLFAFQLNDEDPWKVFVSDEDLFIFKRKRFLVNIDGKETRVSQALFIDLDLLKDVTDKKIRRIL